MASIVIPTIIQGPAYIKVGSTGPVMYCQKDISVNQGAESWNPESTMGKLGERLKARKDVLSFTPVGMLTSTLLNFLYAAFLTPTGIGKSIFAATPTVTISSVTEGVTYVWQRGGITKAPGLSCKPTVTAFGSMEVTCIGEAATSPTDANWWKQANGTTGADTSFDETKIISDIYSAALGTRLTPYNAMGGMDGFEVDFGYEVAEVPASDVGIADIILSSLSTGVKFAPSNLTETQVDTLLGLQTASAVLPGQAFAKGTGGPPLVREALVITGTQIGCVFTVNAQGAKSTGRVYGIGQHRFKELVMVNERTFTTGVPDAMFAFTLPAGW